MKAKRAILILSRRAPSPAEPAAFQVFVLVLSQTIIEGIDVARRKIRSKSPNQAFGVWFRASKIVANTSPKL